MKFFLLLIAAVLGGCVQTEIIGNNPDKIKTITVWSSDLKLNYDRLSDDERPRRKKVEEEQEQPLEEAEEEVPEFWVELVEINKKGKELPTDDLDKLIGAEVEKKVREDEEKTKKIKSVKESESEQEGRNGIPERKIWIVVLAALLSFGGYFTSVKKM